MMMAVIQLICPPRLRLGAKMSLTSCQPREQRRITSQHLRGECRERVVRHRYPKRPLSFLRHHVQFVGQVQHHVAGDGVVPSFCAALGVVAAVHVGELVQQVIAFELEQHTAFE